ncbi:hypothetical protein F5146DRAFT_998440 [Armillaria mellea]|nr:hypothetical protein F5146DRAFT_998440 [Armillaria mellea]
MGNPRASPSSFNENYRGKMVGKYDWDFSLPIPAEVIAPPGSSPSMTSQGSGSFRLPQTFLERNIRTGIQYELCDSIKRPRFHPTSSPLLGPGADSDDRHRISSFTVKGTVFKAREVQVNCVVRKLYLKSITDPNPLPGFTRKATVKVTSEDLGTGVWWPVRENGQEHSKRLNGEIRLSQNLKSTCVIGNFMVQYSVVAPPFSATAFVSEDPEKPLAEFDVEIATTHASGPRLLIYAQHPSDGEVVITESYTILSGTSVPFVIDNARKDIANLWREVPDMLSMGLIDVFFFYLNKEPPTDFSRATYEKTPAADRAFVSLLGLSKIFNFLRDGHPYEQQMVDGRWLARSLQMERRSTLDVITAAWYSISRTDPVRDIMAATQGTSEIATQLWDCLDRVVKAEGENADNTALTAVSRLKTIIHSSQMNHTAVVIYLDLIGHLCRKPRHPLRHAFLNLNVIPMFTKIAFNASKMLNEEAPDIMLGVMVSSMCFMFNCLESLDGFTWVIQVVNAGFLTAWVDSSTHFHRLHTEDRDTVISNVRDIVPRYLVYRSVINAINGNDRVQPIFGLNLTFPFKGRVLGNNVKDVWIDFHKQCLERLLVSIHAKTPGKKAAIKRCVHKVKQQERKVSLTHSTLIEGKLQSITKSDAARDAGHHLPYLHRLACKEHPAIKDSGFIIYIDYTVLPAMFSLKLLSDYEQNIPTSLDGSSNAEARNEAFSQLSNGNGVQLITSVVTGDFWNGGTWDFPVDPSHGDDERDSFDDEDYDTTYRRH